MPDVKNAVRLVLGLLIVLSVAPITAAQSGRGSLSGLVCSRVGNDGMPGVKIELRSIETISHKEVTQSTVTNKDGLYEMLQVTMGEYWLTISTDGYEPYRTKVFIPSDGHIVWGTVLRQRKK